MFAAGRLLDKVGNRAIAFRQTDDKALSDREIGIHLTIVGNSNQWFTDVTADKCTDMPGNHGSDTIDGTLHLGTRQLPTGILLLSLGLHQCSLSLQQLMAGGFYAEVTDHTTLLQLLLTIVVHAGCRQLSFSTFPIGYSHLQGSLKRRLVDDEQRLSTLYSHAFASTDAGDGA